MRILIVGGGPGGLYTAILLQKANPAHDITIIERNPRGVTFGWGVVFSDETLGYLHEADPESHVEITKTFAHWNAIDTYFKGELIRSVGHGFSGIARKKLLDILVDRAEGLGITIRFQSEFEEWSRRADYDVVVAADGVNSRTRNEFADQFKPDLQRNQCKFIWLGTNHLLDAFTFIFEEVPEGWFTVHSYRFDSDTSTFIVETDEQTWRGVGLDKMPVADGIAYLEKLFARYIGGARLLANHSSWVNFTTVRNERWYHDNIVLLGDAVHTAHFSIGSGTKIAMEDAMALAKALTDHPGNRDGAFAAYVAEREPVVSRIQRAAGVSRRWYENVRRHARLEPLQLKFSMMTRSRQITYDNLRLRDPELVERVTRWYAERECGRFGDPTRATGADGTPTPPMFVPLRLRGMTLENRVMVSPMCMYSAVDGTPDDFHLVHLGSRAIGGAGLVYTEMTNIAADARISPGCAGMYKPEHVAAWRRIVEFVHAQSQARICMQLAHAGRKGSTQVSWQEMDAPLTEGNWPLLSASPIPYTDRSQVPKQMDRADMERVRDQFVRAAGMADAAGFDMIELHMAHGYLLASFLSPLTNHRTDDYGGTIGNRLRYPLEVFAAVRAVWPTAKPMAVRISATDWHPDGLTDDDAIAIGRALKAHGLDILDVSAGQTVREQRPVYGRMFQSPWSELLRNEVGIPTITVGNITTADQINTLLAAGRADVCALARPHLLDPYFTLHAAAATGHYQARWPRPYQAVQPRPTPAANKKTRS